MKIRKKAVISGELAMSNFPTRNHFAVELPDRAVIVSWGDGIARFSIDVAESVGGDFLDNDLLDYVMENFENLMRFKLHYLCKYELSVNMEACGAAGFYFDEHLIVMLSAMNCSIEVNLE